jgi:hypothetical protein
MARILDCRDSCDIVGGSTRSAPDPSIFDGDVPCLTPKGFLSPHDRSVSRGERNLLRKGLEICTAQLLPPGTVLVTSRAPIGIAAIAKNRIATNQGFRSLTRKPGVDSECLFYWLNFIGSKHTLTSFNGTPAVPSSKSYPEQRLLKWVFACRPALEQLAVV